MTSAPAAVYGRRRWRLRLPRTAGKHDAHHRVTDGAIVCGRSSGNVVGGRGGRGMHCQAVIANKAVAYIGEVS